MPNMIEIDGKRLLSCLKKERRTLEQVQAELSYVIDHVKQLVNKGDTNGKTD